MQEIKTTDRRWKVKLRIYDLSNGLLKMISPILLFKKMDGMWHTGVEVFGYEYFYGGGIVKLRPVEFEQQFGMTPERVISLGYTNIPQGKFEHHLIEIRGNFSSHFYDLTQWNCNNFTDYIAKYLVGVGIPSEIVNLPREINQTFIGRLVITSLKKWTDDSDIAPGDENHPKTMMESLGNKHTRAHARNAKKHRPQSSGVSITSPTKSGTCRIHIDDNGLFIKNKGEQEAEELLMVPKSPEYAELSKAGRLNRIELIRKGWKCRSLKQGEVPVGSPSGLGHSIDGIAVTRPKKKGAEFGKLSRTSHSRSRSREEQYL